MKFAVTVDNRKQSSIPGRQDNNGNYYDVKVSCTNGTTVGEWDYNAWNVKLDDISDGSKCTLAFTGGMSKEEYQKYIEQGIATRRNTYRGKDLTEFFNNNPDAFYKQISEGTFDDIYVGDYIKKGTDSSSRTITWLVADIDNYLNTGGNDQVLTKHHLTIIPALPLMEAKMNEENTTAGGYLNSTMKTTTLPKILTDYIKPVFGEDKILTLNIRLTNNMNSDVISRIADSITGFKKGAASGSVATSTKIDIMNEMNVYGSIIWSSSGYDIGHDNKQYALFRLKPDFINHYNDYMSYFLRDIASSYYYSSVYFDGSCNFTDAQANNYGVRPRFLIG